MTRGLNPPNTLSTEDVRTLRSVRRDIYSQAILGGGLGLCGGVVLFTGGQWARKLGFVGRGQSLRYNRNTGMLVVLSSFALGQFVAASATGKELVHLIRPMFMAREEKPTGGSGDCGNVDVDVDVPPAVVVDPKRLYDMRLARRKSLAETLYEQKGGISDSHSGRWVEDMETKFEKEY
eukprot:CAMPEP_0168176442 /NCGR_PEP_ID=MMETSP0139_2-20121125/7790_1 /TAXON_ID=44445 /ORGANISM="Pseudo-nitzschia australis, Strain 10249 10 AB" /LENGTH=177 /DNA_ID=CAMNT_0008095161 /DNA_START=111 /DNA_END=644 /DNA_ORIENTATION=+